MGLNKLLKPKSLVPITNLIKTDSSTNVVAEKYQNKTVSS